MHLPCKQAYVGALPTDSTSLRPRCSERAKAAAPKHGVRRRVSRSTRTTARQASQYLINFGGMSFHYAYILQNLVNPDRFYVGMTEDLQQRLRKHNAGETLHTSKFKPWSIKTAIAFRNRDRASAFERYLKSGSGRAFARKHF